MTNDERRAVEVLRDEIKARKVKLVDDRGQELHALFECVKLAGFELRKGKP